MRTRRLLLSAIYATLVACTCTAFATNSALPTITTPYGVFKLGKKPYPPGTREQFVKSGMALGALPDGLYAKSRMASGQANNASGMPPIGYQGSEGSCTAWAGAYALKTYYMKRKNPALNITQPSGQASPRFAYNLYNGGMDNGAYGHEPFEVFMRYGCASMAQKPFIEGQVAPLPTVADYIEGLHRRTTNYVWLWDWAPTTAQVEQLKVHLDNGGVAVIGIYAGDPTFSSWGSGGNYTPWNGSACTFNNIDHLVCVCGYGTGWYLVANSWGTSYGSNGFIYVNSTYFENYISDCMFPLEGSHAAVTNYGIVNITHTRRGDIQDARFIVNGVHVRQFSPAIPDLPDSATYLPDLRTDVNFAVDLSAAPWSPVANTVTARIADRVSSQSGTLTNFAMRFDGANYTSPNPPVPIGDNDGTFATAVISLPGSSLVPNMPVNTSPPNGATNQPITPVLAATPFGDLDFGDTHAASQWQVTTDSFTSLMYDSGTDTTYLALNTESCILPLSTRFYWRVRYMDNHGKWSAYSNPTWFETAASVISNPTPVIAPLSIDFLASQTWATITVGNNGGGNFSFSAVATATPGWLSVAPAIGAVTNMDATLVATATRASMVTGVYIGTVTVTPSVGVAVVVTCRMEVAGNSVVAHAGEQYVTDQGTPAVFDGSASVGNNLNYRWEIDDVVVAPYSTSNVQYRYTGYVPGTNSVILYIRDNNVPPITDSDSALLYVRNVVPVVDAGGPYTGTVGHAVNFLARISDPGTGETHQIRWNFGMGWTGWQSASATNTAFTFASSGGFTLQCEAKDNYNGVGSATAQVMIDMTNLPPTARATLGVPGMVYSNYAGLQVMLVLDGSGSTDELLTATNLFFDWREDVENPAKPLLSDTQKHLMVLTNAMTFPLPGSYKFHLVVNDGEYNSKPATVQADIPGLAGIVKSDGIGAVLPLYGVTLRTTNASLGQARECVSDMEGRYVLDTGTGNWRIIELTRNGRTNIAAANVGPNGDRNCTLTFMPALCSYNDLVNSGFYGGAWGAIPFASEQIVIGSKVGYSGVGDIGGNIPFGGIPELWPRNPAVNYQVMVQKHGWESDLLPIQPDQANPSPLNTSLRPCVDVSTVSGEVRGTNNLPVAGIKVDFGPIFGSVYSDTNGAFVIGSMMRGKYYVRLSATDFETTYQLVQVPPGDTNLHLWSPLVIRGGQFWVHGEILDEESGKPIGGATASINDAGARKGYSNQSGRKAVDTTHAGYYDLPVDKGSRTIIFSALGYDSTTIMVNAQNHVHQPVQLKPVPEPMIIVFSVAICALIRARAGGILSRNGV